MIQGKRRAWLKRLLILLSGPVVMVVVVLTVFAVFERGPGYTAEQWNQDHGDAFTYYLSEYTIPINSARAEKQACNEKNTLADSIEPCKRFVQILTEREDELIRVADRFEYLAGMAPNDIPAEWKQASYETARILRSMREANMLLVAGWTERDEEKWKLGWRQKDKADQAFRTLSRELNTGETP